MTISPEAKLPHMCRDLHEEIQHKSDGEMCPLCIALGTIERLRGEVEKAYREGVALQGFDLGYANKHWNDSRAKRVAEGKE